MLDMPQPRTAPLGLSTLSAVLLLALIGLVVVIVVRHSRARPVIIHTSSGVTTRGRAEPESASNKPKPVSPGFQGCPPAGDGGDRQLNFLKNRIDSTAWKPTPFETVLQLRWPSDVTRRARAEWSSGDSVAVARREGSPVSVEGYFAGAKQEGPEATNCHGADRTFRDWHLWLSEEPGRDRRHSIVVEATPIVRAAHPEWSLSTIHELVRDSIPVRVSGWLLLDQEHPEQLGKTRGTLWEIHPVLRIEVRRGSAWEVLSAAR
jgi:hypothetical protein